MEERSRAEIYRFYIQVFIKTIKSTYLIFIRYQIWERNVVYACKTNYSTEKLKSEKISVYRFPKDETEKEKQIKAVPNANLRVSKDTVVFALHQPSGFEEIKVNGKSRPKDLPSI